MQKQQLGWKIPNRHSQVVRWTRKEAALLGTRTDAEVARMIGRWADRCYNAECGCTFRFTNRAQSSAGVCGWGGREWLTENRKRNGALGTATPYLLGSPKVDPPSPSLWRTGVSREHGAGSGEKQLSVIGGRELPNEEVLCDEWGMTGTKTGSAVRTNKNLGDPGLERSRLHRGTSRV